VKLWHFTCDHGHRALGARGLLKPNVHVLMPALGAVVWLTTDGAPHRDDVGLTSTTLRCDRMAYRYRVTEEKPPVVPWATARTLVDPQVVADLESYAEPSTWWLAMAPVEAVLA
jgi:hypothetical protein